MARLLAIGPAVTAPILGDFYGDGDIADALAGQRDDGTSQELADWQSGFGFGEAVLATVAAPEPKTAMLVLTMLDFMRPRGR